jgi:hypothetical protein
LDIAKRAIGHFEGVCKKPKLPLRRPDGDSRAGSPKRPLIGARPPKSKPSNSHLPISPMAGILLLKEKLEAKKKNRMQNSSKLKIAKVFFISTF